MIVSIQFLDIHQILRSQAPEEAQHLLESFEVAHLASKEQSTSYLHKWPIEVFVRLL